MEVNGGLHGYDESSIASARAAWENGYSARGKFVASFNFHFGFDLSGRREGSIIVVKMNMPPARPITPAEEQFITTYREIMRVSQQNAHYAYILSEAVRSAAKAQGI